MKDLTECVPARKDFQRWLDLGKAPSTICQGEKAVAIVTRLEKNSSIDYLYMAGVTRDGGVSWDNSLQFCGVFDRQRQALYLTKDALSCITAGAAPLASEAEPSIRGKLQSEINQRVEDTIANDRNNLAVRELTGWCASRDLDEYLEYGAQREALERFFNDREPDGQFHGGYILDELTEDAFLSWLRDPEGFIQTEAEQYIKNNQEQFLLEFLKSDALQKEYQDVMRDTGSLIHRKKAISDAVTASGAKTVTVTVQTGEGELAFKTSASSLTGLNAGYSRHDIAAPDRREFARLFGEYGDYGPEDVVKITYGRNTIYEAPSVEGIAEKETHQMGMGGMHL